MSGVIESFLAPSALSVVFQPIFDVRAEPAVWGSEALTRGPKGTHFEPAPVLFDYVRLKEEEVRFDRSCVKRAIAAAAPLDTPLLFVNVHAATMERDPSFAAHLAKTCRELDFDPGRLVVELVEHKAYWQTVRLYECLLAIRDSGVGIALDDIGCGSNTLRTILDVRPDYVKIERYFVDGCAFDPGRQSILRSLVALARDFETAVVAKGVESAQDLEFIRQAGIHFAQGFLLARPEEEPQSICPPQSLQQGNSR